MFIFECLQSNSKMDDIFGNQYMMNFFSYHHELEMEQIYGMLGNIDANTGDAQTVNGAYSPILFD